MFYTEHTLQWRENVILHVYEHFLWHIKNITGNVHYSILYSPPISGPEYVLYYMNVSCHRHKEFTSAARTPVTNHVFHCTLHFSLLMSNSAHNTPPYHQHIDTLCLENDYYSCSTSLWLKTKHRSTEDGNIWLLVIFAIIM